MQTKYNARPEINTGKMEKWDEEGEGGGLKLKSGLGIVGVVGVGV